jgi:hypothetical protein
MHILVFPDQAWTPLQGCLIVDIPDDMDDEEVSDVLLNEGGTVLYNFIGDENIGSYRQNSETVERRRLHDYKNEAR